MNATNATKPVEPISEFRMNELARSRRRSRTISGKELAKLGIKDVNTFA